MSAARILDFPAITSGHPTFDTRLPSEQPTFSIADRAGSHNSLQKLGSRELYPQLEMEESYAGAAISLLDNIGKFIDQAKHTDATYLESDTSLMKAKIDLRRAFAYRDALGQGYGGVVNAALWGLINFEVESPSIHQLRTLSNVIGRLRHSPYMHFDTAMTLMDDLEADGFDIEPPSLDNLFEKEQGANG